MNITSQCKFCHKTIYPNPYGKIGVYCSNSCQSRAEQKKIQKTSICLCCGKQFFHYGEQVFCGRECIAKNLNKLKFNRHGKTQERKCAYCMQYFSFTPSLLGEERKYCSLRCSHQIENLTNKNSPLSLAEIANQTLQRDEYTCQLCGTSDEVLIPNYINNNLTNRITTCVTCSRLMKEEPLFWQIVISGLTSGSYLVQKEWGGEIHIVNHDDYCLKYLFFFEGMQFSHHYHILKKELWHCICGEFECVLQYNGCKKYLTLGHGEQLEVNRGVIHQLQAKCNSVLVEVSTRHFNEDSFRVMKSQNF